ncbi:hypothetical protein PHET_04047, partial [Paragonimus heterotremus]
GALSSGTRRAFEDCKRNATSCVTGNYPGKNSSQIMNECMDIFYKCAVVGFTQNERCQSTLKNTGTKSAGTLRLSIDLNLPENAISVAAKKENIPKTDRPIIKKTPGTNKTIS